MRNPNIYSSASQQGLSLIELMVAILILGIISTGAVPAMSNLMDSYRSKQSVLSLQQALNSARTLALDRTQTTTICPIDNQKCSNDWSKPLAIFADVDSNREIGENETLHMQLSNEATSGNWIKRRPEQNYISFSPQGHAFTSSTTFVYCPSSGQMSNARQLVINFQGRIKSNHYLSSLGTPYASLAGLNCP